MVYALAVIAVWIPLIEGKPGFKLLSNGEVKRVGYLRHLSKNGRPAR